MKNTQEAFRWMVTLLQQKKIPFQISGGFAAWVYRSPRELADLDFDIPEAYFDALLPDIKPFIAYGPNRYQSGQWDLNLITLVYNDQEIDLAGVEQCYIFNSLTHRWERLITNFEAANTVEVFGIPVPVINKEDLITYKQKLRRDVDLFDVNALTQIN